MASGFGKKRRAAPVMAEESYYNSYYAGYCY